MKTTFIMIRHGFSVANNEKRFAGHSDFPLTELGQLQAKRCAEALKHEKIDAVYSSDLKRAYQTAEPIARSHGLKVIPHKGLREIFAGEWEGKTFDQIDRDYAEDYSVWKNDIGKAKCTGGERVSELSGRVLAALTEIAESNCGKTVCIATHATPIRAVCTAAAGYPAEDMGKIPWTANASISIFEYENGKFCAVCISKTEHLGELCTSLPKNV